MLAPGSVASTKFESLRRVSISDGWGELLVRLKRLRGCARVSGHLGSLLGQAGRMWLASWWAAELLGGGRRRREDEDVRRAFLWARS
jgi:hypothetical protein